MQLPTTGCSCSVRVTNASYTTPQNVDTVFSTFHLFSSFAIARTMSLGGLMLLFLDITL